MKLSFLKLAILGVVVSFNAAAWAATTGGEPSAVGLWEQVDEKTGQAESWFRITEKNGVFGGQIVKMFPKPGDEPPEKWLCSKCEGAERNAPVLGLALIKNMRKNGLAYENGTIMDPRDGSVYRALMQLSPDGKQLEVRGYLGISLFGRSQTWNRLPDNALEPPAAQRPAQRPQAPRR
jgi:uncharacterized protein (DUF2147 family)